MKIKITTYYKWTDEDGEDRLCDLEEMHELFDTDDDWPAVEMVYGVSAGGAFICDISDLDLAKIIAQLLRTKGGQTELETYLATKELLKP